MRIHIFKRRLMTLVEIMIVMFLIAMITGVIAYNYTGSLEEGKAFKTKSGIARIHSILDLYIVNHPDELDTLSTNWEGIVKSSPMVQNADELIRDGWGNTYQVTVSDHGEILIHSNRYEHYLQNKGRSSLFQKNKS